MVSERLQPARICALIPARGGSKGIPNKNLALFNGKSLLEWAIESARRASQIDDVFVSTDSSPIATAAGDLGAQVIVRPGALATDDAPMDPVIEHALHERCAAPSELWVLLQPTSPLRTGRHVDEAISLLVRSPGAGGVVSVFEADPHWLKAYGVDARGFIAGLFGSDAPYARRQDLPTPLLPNGAIYAFWVHEFMMHRRIPRAGMLPYLMTFEDSVDIDTADDLALADARFRGK